VSAPPPSLGCHGRTFTGSDGKVYWPSIFVTLTLPSYGKVPEDVPLDPDHYGRAARDALRFSKPVDRFVQNLRRVAGFEVQYFATVEPQKRLALRAGRPGAGTAALADAKCRSEPLPVLSARPEPHAACRYAAATA
jgi:hypothetical protein